MRGRVISSSTGVLALVGHPVAHSVSPAMHNAAIAAAGLDLVYVALDVLPDRLPVALAGLGALGLRGANVTVPHKQAAMAACDRLTDEARAVGAVNTLTVEADGLVGDNTDVAGFVAGLQAATSANALGAPRSAVVLGTGGAARAVVVALVRHGVQVTVLARDRDRGERLTDVDPSAAGPRVVTLDDAAVVATAVAAADVVVNATPLGWHGERLPDPLHDLGTGQVAYDLNYPDPASPFLADARRAGAAVVDGVDMVVGQAAASLRGWIGIEPDVAVMRTAALHGRVSDGTGGRDPA